MKVIIIEIIIIIILIFAIICDGKDYIIMHHSVPPMPDLKEIHY